MKKQFNIYSSDNMEQLAAQYRQCRANDSEQFFSKNLFLSERIITPSNGIRQWLERTLVEQGVFLANVEFLTPQGFISGLLRQAFHDIGETSLALFGRKQMEWRIMELLQSSLNDFPNLETYLNSAAKGESIELRRYSLAEKIASLFNYYIEEVPELLARKKLFTACPNNNFWIIDHWEAKLWQKLCVDENAKPLTSPADLVIQFLSTDINKLGLGNQRPVTLFGMSSLTPATLTILKRYSEIATVNIFCLNPVDSFWGEDVRKSWENGTLTKEPDEVEKLFKESPILGQWALHERHCFQELLGLSHHAGLPEYSPSNRQWEKPTGKLVFQGHQTSAEDLKAPNGVLQAFQYSLLNKDVSGFVADDTVTVHNCHSPAREVEILHDHLLHLIQTRKYTNSDIIVAAPDITVFEPYVRAVFDRQVPRSDGKNIDYCRLSYSFYGLGFRKSNPLADVFLSILDIKKSRYDYYLLEKLLMTPEIRKQYNLNDEDFSTIHSWCQAAGIFWGADGKRQQYGLPDYETFSWRFGLDRMLLGFALEENIDEEDETFYSQWQEVAPFDACDSLDNRPRLQALLEFFRDLRKVDQLLDYTGPIEEWKKRLIECISTFFACDLDRKAYYRGLFSAVNFLASEVNGAGYTRDIPLEVIREALKKHFSVAAEEEFLNGRITFCNLRDARCIPCKVLCLLGMDETAYPKISRSDSFNLANETMEESFRSTRFQDRFFFLENLLEVRDYLLIYYRGQDDVTSKDFSPSPIVTELCVYINNLFPDLALEVKQELLPYSHAHFIEKQGDYHLNQHWSFNQDACDIDKTLNDKQLELSLFADGNQQCENTDNRRESYREPGLFPSDSLNDTITVNLKELEDFFYNAGFTFLKNSFSFPRQISFKNIPPQTETIDLDNLTQWKIKNCLSHWLLSIVPPNTDNLASIPDSDKNQILEECHNQLCSRNLLPPGHFGRKQLEPLLEASWIVDRIRRSAWKEYCQCHENRLLKLEFNNEIIQLPDKPLYTPDQVEWDDQSAPRYSKVILQYSTRKPKDVAQVMLTLGGTDPKYKTRIHLRHWFFNAIGEHIVSYLVQNAQTDQKDAGSLEPLESAIPKAQLRKILTFYLYAKTHPLPIMNRCMWDGVEGFCKTGQGGSSYGDFELDYVRLLWGDASLDSEAVIEALSQLLKLPPT